MPWCPRCGVGLSPDGDEGGLSARRPSVGVRASSRCGDRSGNRIGEPARLDDDALDADQQRRRRRQSGADVSARSSTRTRSTTSPRARFTAQRLEEQFKKKEWVEGVPKLKTLEQIFKEKGGYEIVGEVNGADLVGWAYDGPFDELPAQSHPARLSRPRSPTSSSSRTGRPDEVGARTSIASSPGTTVGETEGTGIVHIAPGCGKEDFALGKEQGLPPIAPLDDDGVFLPGFGALTGKSAVDPATTDWILDNLQEKGLLFAVENVSAQLSALLALQDGAAVPPGRRVVHQHERGATRS